MANKKEIAAQLMEHLCNHEYHGYSQGARWGDGEGVCNVNIDGVNYQLAQGDRDCSSAVIDSYQTAGVDCGGATYTGNMRQKMCGTGNFKWHPMSSGYIAKRGDIYLNEVNHTAMCLNDNPDILGEFSISENGGIYGNTGDQTGQESHIRSYYNYPWDGILEYVENEIHDNDTVSDKITETSDGVNFTYSIRTEKGTIYPEVTNLNGYAGKRGEAITDIAIHVDKGSVKYRVHVLGGDWLEYVTDCNWEDDENGYAGNGKVIDAIEVYYYTPDDFARMYGYQQAQYRVSPINGDYYDWQYDNDTDKGQDGYAGCFGKKIDRFQLF